MNWTMTKTAYSIFRKSMCGEYIIQSERREVQGADVLFADGTQQWVKNYFALFGRKGTWQLGNYRTLREAIEAAVLASADAARKM